MSLIHFIFTLSFFVSKILSYSTSCSSSSSGTLKSTNQYQSNGLCENTCGGYAYAIVSGRECYCSNSGPSSTTDSSKCDTDCPGYPYEQCAGDGYYLYIQLKDVESSTSSTSSSVSTKATSSETSAATTSQAGDDDDDTDSTVLITKTSVSVASASSSIQTLTSVVVVTSDDSDSTAFKTIVQTTTKIASNSQAVSSVHVITSVVTSISESHSSGLSSATNTASSETASSTASDVSSLSSSTSSTTSTGVSASASSTTPSSEGSSKKNKSFWNSPGKVAGTFTVVGLVILGLIASLIFCCLRRQLGDRDDDEDEEGGFFKRRRTSNNTLAGGSTSAMNSPILMEKTNLHSNSQSYSETVIPVPLNTTEVDQRLDPNQMFYNNLAIEEDNKSISDEFDYSRKFLRVANPDLRSSISKSSTVNE